MTHATHTRALLGALGTAFLVGASAARAQDADNGQLSIHGYLTQAYAITSGVQHYGMTGQGSTDFRYAALQVRYDKGQDAFLIQLNNRRLGRSPITDYESAITVNWAFYEHRFKDGIQLRAGRVPVPRGIYNELRSVGVLLPFYRAPVIFYDEGAYFSETVDGAVLSKTFYDGKPWSLETHLYGGGWSLLQYDQSGTDYTVGRVRAENGFGGQLWINTPVEGLRIGGAAQHYLWHSIDETSNEFADKQQVFDLQGSIDFTRERFMLRAETLEQHYETDHYFANYAQAGVHLTAKLAVNVMGEYGYERAWKDTTVYPQNFDWHKSFGTGIAYAFQPSLVAKLESHWDRGIQVEQHADPRLPPRFRYFIGSISASF